MESIRADYGLADFWVITQFASDNLQIGVSNCQLGKIT
jgi:hypothetical protein